MSGSLAFRCFWLPHAIGVMLALCPLPDAHARQDELPARSDDGTVIEEIIVRAQRREQAANDVPISMSVFANADLEALNLRDVSEIAQYTPNLTWDSAFFGAANSGSVFIRGVGQTAGFAEHVADPAVGLYLDGVYIARGVGSVLGTHDVSQVEVLRGPQGTLFGKNSTGGAITVVTNRPLPRVSGWADLTTGSDNRADLRVVANVPVTDRWLTRLAAASLNREGYGVSLQDGSEFGDVNSDSVRGSLRWLVSANVTVDLIADWMRTRQGSAPAKLMRADPNPMTLTAAFNTFVTPTNTVEGFGEGIPYDSRFITPDSFTNYATADSGNELDVAGLTAIVEWRPGELTFSSISGYRNLDSHWAFDTDLSPLTVIETIQQADQHQFSQEFVLQGVSGSLDWLVGLYYFEEEADKSGGTILLPELGMVEFDPVTGDPNPFFGFRFSNGIRSFAFSTGRAQSAAAFAHVDYALTEDLSGFMGARYTVEEKRISNPPGAGNVASNGDTDTFTNLSPTIGMQYFFNPELQVYGSISRGFRSGGFNFNPFSVRENYLPFDQEESTSYEMGVKSGGGRYWVSAAIFLTEYEDIQISVINDAEPAVVNAADAEIMGAELELAASLGEGWLLQSGIGYLDAKYVDLNPRGIANLQVPFSLDSRLVNAPQWSVNLGLRYSSPPTRVGRFLVRGDFSWVDETWNNAINSLELVQEAFELLHASASLVTNDDTWEVTLFGHNLTDQEYIQNGDAGSLLGIALANVSRPRNWGFRVQYRFGGRER